VPLLIYTLAFALQLRKSKQNLYQPSSHRATRCAELAVSILSLSLMLPFPYKPAVIRPSPPTGSLPLAWY
jgi:hypothetical protein